MFFLNVDADNYPNRQNNSVIVTVLQVLDSMLINGVQTEIFFVRNYTQLE